MKTKKSHFLFAGRLVGFSLLLLASAGAMSQNAASAAPGNSNAASILNLQIHHASISVADIQAEANWYGKTFGFSFPTGGKIEHINPKMQGARLVIPGFQLDLIQFEGSKRPEKPSPVFMQQGYIHLVFTVSDLDAALSFLQGASADVTPNRNREGKLSGLVVHDPEGNEIELTGR
jgi:catechol 2,3-dioxygenase-like lactoylglutathione lyase family enzyme